MKKYTASRLTNGNRVFPATLTIDELGVTLKLPNLFGGEEKTIPFTRIASVKIECPFIGFSNIMIETTGEGMITVHGFTKNEVVEIKSEILSNINGHPPTR